MKSVCYTTRHTDWQVKTLCNGQWNHSILPITWSWFLLLHHFFSANYTVNMLQNGDDEPSISQSYAVRREKKNVLSVHARLKEERRLENWDVTISFTEFARTDGFNISTQPAHYVVVLLLGVAGFKVSVEFGTTRLNRIHLHSCRKDTKYI